MLKRLLGFLLVAALLLTVGQSVLAENYEVSFPITFDQTSCRDMLQLINDFRTGDDCWCWNPENTEKVYAEGLEPLVYDYDLEQIAMQRAAECFLYYDHTRPDDTGCFTAFTVDDILALGENIAAGYNKNDTTNAVFTGWREQDKPYEGQGHRRNMLSPDFNCIGIGHVVSGPLHFWAQSLAYRDNPNTAATPVLNEATVVYVTVNSDLFLESSAGSSAVSALTIEYGDTAELPGVTAYIRMAEQWPNSTSISREPDAVTLYPAWTSADPACVGIEGTRAVGKAVGQTSLTASVFDQPCSLNVQVACSTLLTPDFVLPAELTAIEAESFSNTAAVAVEIPGSVTSIGSKAFSACTSLRQITIPATVTQIDANAFDGCPVGLVVCCAAGSRAEAVAQQYGFTIVYLQSLLQ